VVDASTSVPFSLGLLVSPTRRSGIFFPPSLFAGDCRQARSLTACTPTVWPRILTSPCRDLPHRGDFRPFCFPSYWRPAVLVLFHFLSSGDLSPLRHPTSTISGGAGKSPQPTSLNFPLRSRPQQGPFSSRFRFKPEHSPCLLIV